MPIWSQFVPPWDSYPISEGDPDGDTFLLPVCTNHKRLQAMLTALYHYHREDEFNNEHQIDVITALRYIQNPLDNPCVQALLQDCNIVCRTYKPSHFSITYAPNDPHQTPNLAPSPYEAPPWYRWSGQAQGVDLPDWLVEIGTGAKVGDVFVLPTNPPDVFDDIINIIPNPQAILDLINVGLPRFRFYASGEGTVELHLLKVPLGGLALITVDSNPLSYKLVSLSTVNLTSLLDWESVVTSVLGSLGSEGLQLVDTLIQEVELTGLGNHHVDVTFLPFGDLSGNVGYGGGLRKIEACGESLLGIETIMPQFQLTSEGVLEWRPNHDTEFEPLGNIKGEDGLMGLTGLPGLNGEDGQTPIPIWNGYELTFDLDGDNQPDTPPVNLRGAQGQQGLQGLQGLQGQQGLQGIQGQQGVAGQNGQDGQDGQDCNCDGSMGTVNPPNQTDPTQEVCGGSTSLVDWWLAQWGDYYNELSQTSQNVTTIADTFLSIFGLSTVAGVIDTAGAIFEAGISTINTYVTDSDNREQMICVLYQAILDNGNTFNQSTWGAFIAELVNNLLNPAAIAFGKFVEELGYSRAELRYSLGLSSPSSNCGVLCGTTSEWCFEFDFSVSAYEFYTTSGFENGTAGAYAEGVGFTTTLHNNGFHACYIARGFTGYVTEVYAEFGGIGGMACAAFTQSGWIVFENRIEGVNTFTFASGQAQTINQQINSGMFFAFYFPEGGQSGFISKLRLKGTGGSPFGTSNCLS